MIRFKRRAERPAFFWTIKMLFRRKHFEHHKIELCILKKTADPFNIYYPPMPELKPISKDAISQALEKAMRYRLLNEPWQAESICRDILRADPGNQEAIYTLILAITDQFGASFKTSLSDALELVLDLTDVYEAEYCRGLIFERQARAALRRSTPRAEYIAYSHLERAMEHYEKAEKIRPDSNEESVLRWNACVRFIRYYKLRHSSDDEGTQQFLDV